MRLATVTFSELLKKLYDIIVQSESFWYTVSCFLYKRLRSATFFAKDLHLAVRESVGALGRLLNHTAVIITLNWRLQGQLPRAGSINLH